VTPKKAGIPYIIVPDGGQAYQIAGCILESHTWSGVLGKVYEDTSLLAP
jgi:hypothetical protein